MIITTIHRANTHVRGEIQPWAWKYSVSVNGARPMPAGENFDAVIAWCKLRGADRVFLAWENAKARLYWDSIRP